MTTHFASLPKNRPARAASAANSPSPTTRLTTAVRNATPRMPHYRLCMPRANPRQTTHRNPCYDDTLLPRRWHSLPAGCGPTREI
eukprot:493025-Pyramimonas_sp.AAC.1